VLNKIAAVWLIGDVLLVLWLFTSAIVCLAGGPPLWLAPQHVVLVLLGWIVAAPLGIILGAFVYTLTDYAVELWRKK
jgi:hypothetical protein